MAATAENDDAVNHQPSQQQDIVKRFVRSLYASASLGGEGKLRRRRGRSTTTKPTNDDDSNNPDTSPELKSDICSTAGDGEVEAQKSVNATVEESCTSDQDVSLYVQKGLKHDEVVQSDTQDLTPSQQCLQDEKGRDGSKPEVAKVASVVEQATSISHKSKQYARKSTLLLPNSSPNVKSIKCDQIKHLSRTVRWKIQFQLLEFPTSPRAAVTSTDATSEGKGMVEIDSSDSGIKIDNSPMAAKFQSSHESSHRITENENAKSPLHMTDVDVMNLNRNLVKQQAVRVQSLIERYNLALSNAQQRHHERSGGYEQEQRNSQITQEESEEKEWEEVEYEEVLQCEENHDEVETPSSASALQLTLEKAVAAEFEPRSSDDGSISKGENFCEEKVEESTSASTIDYCDDEQQNVTLSILSSEQNQSSNKKSQEEKDMTSTRDSRENIELLDIILKDLNRLPPRLISWQFDDEGQFVALSSPYEDGNDQIHVDNSQKVLPQTSLHAQGCEEEQDIVRSQHIEWLTVLLFAYAKEHPDIGYRQGMHEILAYTVLALEQDFKSDFSHSLTTPAWRKNIQTDAYLLFEAWMDGLKSAYRDEDCHEEDHNQDTQAINENEHLDVDGTRSASTEQYDSNAGHEENMKSFNSNVQSDSSDNINVNGNRCLSPHRSKTAGLNLGERILQLTSFASSSVYYVLLKVTHDMGVPPELYCAKWLRLLFGREFCKRQHVLEFWDFLLNLLYDPWYILWHTQALQERVNSTLVAKYPHGSSSLPKESDNESLHSSSSSSTKTTTAAACDAKEITATDTYGKTENKSPNDTMTQRENAITSAKNVVGSTLTLMNVIECVACSMILLQRKTLIQNLNSNHQQSIMSSSTSTLRSSLRRVGTEMRDRSKGRRSSSKEMESDDQHRQSTSNAISSSSSSSKQPLTQSLKMNPFYFFVQDDEDEERAIREGLCLLMNYPTMTSPRELMVMSIRVVRFHMEHRLGMIVQASSTYASSALMKQKRNTGGNSSSSIPNNLEVDKKKKKKKKKRLSKSASTSNIQVAPPITSYARRFPLATGV